ncbi:MAG: NifB/NifX family molybdenum-iron cluster-binding protein [Desulfoprunum sp.]
MTVLNFPATRRIIRLPVAPKASSRIRFAPLQPPAAQALTPSEAVRLVEAMAVGEDCRIELTGPGDPLATADRALATLDALVARYPLARLSLATLGIGGDGLAKVLQQAGLAEIRLQVNAVDPSYLEKIYAWIRPGLKTLALPEAARILVAEQRQTVIAGKEAGLTVTIVTTVYPEHNGDHLEEIACAMAALGADGMVLVPCQTEEHGADIVLPAVDPAWLADAGRRCARHLPVETAAPDKGCMTAPPTVLSRLPQATASRPNVAVASSNGVDIDLHLGQTRTFLVYGRREDGLVSLLGTRPAPEPGGGTDRWRQLADRLADCFAILAASAGETPRQQLARVGITVLLGHDNIEGTVDALYGGGKKGKSGRKSG